MTVIGKILKMHPTTEYNKNLKNQNYFLNINSLICINIKKLIFMFLDN